MFRKIMVVAATVAMPVAAITAVTAVAGPGTAFAKTVVPVGAISCTQSGSVTFAKPGLSAAGTLTKKTAEDTKAAVTPAGTGCSGKAIKVTIVSTPTPCPQTNGVPNSGDPAACQASKTSGKGVVTYTIAKDPNYYDTSGSFATSGTSDLQAALANGLATTDNGNKVILEYGTADEVQPGGVCGSDVGFSLTGAVDTSAGAATGYNYSDAICLTTDAGTGTTGNFFPDLGSQLFGTSEEGGNPDSVIASAVIGGSSVLTVSAAS